MFKKNIPQPSCGGKDIAKAKGVHREMGYEERIRQNYGLVSIRGSLADAFKSIPNLFLYFFTEINCINNRTNQ